MRRLILAAALLATPIGGPLDAQAPEPDDEGWVGDCRNGGWNDDRGRACEVRVVPLKLSGRAIEVDSRENGSVRVVAWDGDSVNVTAHIQANADDDDAARAVLKDVRINTDGRRIFSEGPHEWRREHWYVSYVLRVPRRFDLDLEAHNGSLGVNGVTGRMELRTTNGSVNLVDVGGDVRAHTQNGSGSVRLARPKRGCPGARPLKQNRVGEPCLPAPQPLPRPRFDATGVGATSIFAPLELAAPNVYRSASGAPGPKYWQNRADYDIKASLDTGTKTLRGSLRFRYTNNSPDSLRFIWMQMEQNAFRDKSLNSYIFPQDSRFGARGFEGGDVVERFDQLLGTRRVAVKRRPNETVMKIDLAEPLAPAKSASFDIAWHFVVPEHGAY